MTLQEWKEKAFRRGTSGDMVFDILRDWEQDRKKLLVEIKELKKEIGWGN